MAIENVNELEAVYIVDGEDDYENPIVLKVEITQILQQGSQTDEGMKDYLGTLLSDACCDFNMVFAKTEDAARQAAQDMQEG